MKVKTKKTKKYKESKKTIFVTKKRVNQAKTDKAFVKRREL